MDKYGGAMNDCIFCKIIKGEIPGYKLYEDDDFLAFLDIRPVNQGHCLVIPKGHYVRVTDMPDELLAKELPLVKRITQALIQATGIPDFDLLNTNGAPAGQVVFHHHMHIIPRKTGDGLTFKIKPVEYGAGEQDKLAEKVRNLLK